MLKWGNKESRVFYFFFDVEDKYENYYKFAESYFKETKRMMTLPIDFQGSVIVSLFTFNHSIELLLKSILQMFDDGKDEYKWLSDDKKTLKKAIVKSHDLKFLYERVVKYGTNLIDSRLVRETFGGIDSEKYDWPTEHESYFLKENMWIDTMNLKYPYTNNEQIHVALTDINISLKSRLELYINVWESINDIYETMEYILFTHKITGEKF